MIVAIVPARGGSKRIPRKNVRPFAGRPMIAHALIAIRESGVFDRVIVSTDSEEIAAAAEAHGAEAPFRRPAQLCDDHTPSAPVLAHALDFLAQHGCQPEYVCVVYATAPFLQPKYLARGLELIRAHAASSAFAVTSFPFPILRGLRIADDGHVEMIWPEHELTRSQDLPEAYHDAGQFYWIDVARFRQDPRLYGRDARPVVLPRYLVQDIDTPEDWETAELMFEALRGRREV